MSDEMRFHVWVSTAHFTDWDDISTDIIPFGDMTLEEVKQLLNLALARGHEVIIARQSEGDSE